MNITTNIKSALRPAIYLIAALLFSPFTFAQSDSKAYPIAVYTPHDYAHYLGLDIQQYIKLYGAMQGNPEAKTGFNYESIQGKSAFIEMMNLMKSDQDVPLKLQNEVKSMFRHNLDNLADYIGVPKTQISSIVNKYRQMAHTVNSLENIRLARQEGQSYTILEDEVEVIVITAPLDKIYTTSSGIYTLYSAQIWDLGIEIGGGSRVTVRVTYINSANGSTFGSQRWLVDRLGAAPAENLSCISPDCELVPQ